MGYMVNDGKMLAYNKKRWINSHTLTSQDKECVGMNVSKPFLFADGPLAAFSFAIAKNIVKHAIETEKHYLWYIEHHNIKRMQSFCDVFYGYLVQKHLQNIDVRMKRITHVHPIKSGHPSEADKQHLFAYQLEKKNII